MLSCLTNFNYKMLTLFCQYNILNNGKNIVHILKEGNDYMFYKDSQEWNGESAHGKIQQQAS